MSSFHAFYGSGERVETTALFMTTTTPEVVPPSVPPSGIENAFLSLPAREPFVTASEAWGALVAVFVLTAGAAVLTPIVALLFFR